MTDARPQAPGFYRFRVGDLSLVALHDGVLIREQPPGFVRNAPDEAVHDAYAAAGMQPGKLTLTFNPLAIDTGNGLVLIDTGLGQSGPPGTGLLAGNLAAAGYAPEDVTAVLISHCHSDHVGGLAVPGAYPKAEVLVPEGEWAFWIDGAASLPDTLKPHGDLARRAFEGRRIRRFAWGEEILPGITAVDAGGHTPGMTAFEITSGGESTMVVADITNNPLVFARHPDWQAMFDFDPDRAVATRRRLLARAAAERLRLSFYHAPFPATGTVITSGDGYEFAPALWTVG